MTDKLKELRRLYDMGFAIIYLRPKSKVPLESGWTTGPRHDWEYLRKTYDPKNNVGVRLGSPSGIGENYLAVVDVDVKSKDPKHRKEAENAAAKVLMGASCPMVLSGRGGGSCHYYCVTARPFKTFNAASSSDVVKVHMPSKERISKREREELSDNELKQGIRLASAWEVSLYSDGRQVVLPPSIHPDSGKSYAWRSPLTEAHFLPTLRFDTASEEKQLGEIASPGSPKEIFKFELSSVNLEWIEIPDSVKALIKKGLWKGRIVENRSDFLLVAANALLSAGMGRDEILTILTERGSYLGEVAYEHAKTDNRTRAAKWLWNYTLKKVMEENDTRGAFMASPIGEESVPDAATLARQAEEIGSDTPWETDLRRRAGKDGEKGGVVASLYNLELILGNDVSQPLFVKNEFSIREAYGVDAPWNRKKGEDLIDFDVIAIKSWLSKSRFKMEPMNQTIEQAMQVIANKNATHPIRNWLESLSWDGKARIDTWIKTYLQGKAPEPYLSDISRKFLVAMIARVYRPGCQWDYTLVLEGEQGTRKSTTARILASDRWFCDHLPDLKDKDAMLNLQGSWLVELGELRNVKHTDAATVKSFLTRRTDRVRAPYGRRWIDANRQSVFIGTVNENEYFKDPTGNRRFWPVLVGRCDTDALARDRDQLFAEAKALFDQGSEDLYLEGESLKQALEQQDDRRVDDDITEMESALAEFMEREFEKHSAERFRFSRFKMKELFSGLSAPWGAWNGKPFATQNGSQVLRNLGFIRAKVKGQRIWRSRGLKGGRGALPPSTNEYNFL